MSVEQRRVEVIDTQTFPVASVRLAKASSRYDRRYRYWVVEILRADHAESDVAEYLCVVDSWPVSDKDSKAAAGRAYTVAWKTVRALGLSMITMGDPSAVRTIEEGERWRNLASDQDAALRDLQAENERLREALSAIKLRCDEIVAGKFGGLNAALDMSNIARRALTSDATSREER